MTGGFAWRRFFKQDTPKRLTNLCPGGFQHSVTAKSVWLLSPSNKNTHGPGQKCGVGKQTLTNWTKWPYCGNRCYLHCTLTYFRNNDWSQMSWWRVVKGGVPRLLVTYCLLCVKERLEIIMLVWCVCMCVCESEREAAKVTFESLYSVQVSS